MLSGCQVERVLEKVAESLNMIFEPVGLFLRSTTLGFLQIALKVYENVPYFGVLAYGTSLVDGITPWLMS
jgi:hypothetical protein